jgi:L-histidine N-alpha-methyltransferase
MHEAAERKADARADVMLREVAEGLARTQKELPPKYFYDTRGARLFDEITRLPEYYLTRLERELLRSFAQGWLRSTGAGALVELGPGSGEKTRILLDALPPGAWYVPVDISRSYLDALATEIAPAYAHLRVVPALSDIAVSLALPRGLPRPVVFAFLGSTIGNFESDAVPLLRRIRRHMNEADHLLLGADLDKDPRVLAAAYNDSRGVTAEFNLNILRVLNRELGADFDVNAYRHRASYDAQRRRIEMHLVATSPQDVRIPGAGSFHLAEGESIRTEISCKYDRERVVSMLADAGLALDSWVTDAAEWYALATARVARCQPRVPADDRVGR